MIDTHWRNSWKGISRFGKHLSLSFRRRWGIFFFSGIQSQDLPTNTFCWTVLQICQIFLLIFMKLNSQHIYILYHHIIYDEDAKEVMFYCWRIIIKLLMNQLWELSGVTINYHDLPWVIMNYHGLSWIITKIMSYHQSILCCWRVIMNLLMSQLSAEIYPKLSWIIIDYHEFTWIIVDYHELSLITRKKLKSSWINVMRLKGNHESADEPIVSLELSSFHTSPNLLGSRPGVHQYMNGNVSNRHTAFIICSAHIFVPIF